MNWQWIVSFNDGQRISSKALLEEDSKRNPWNAVLDYLRKNPTLISGKTREITHIELVIDNKRYNSPSASPNAVFQSGEHFSNFWVFYKNLAYFGHTSNDENFVGVSYRVGDNRFIHWVSEKTGTMITQILDVVNPKTKKEKEFSGVEKSIDEEYGEIYGGSINTL